MKVIHGNEIGLAIFQPLRTDQRLTLRAVPIATTVKGNTLVTAGITLLDVPPERGSSTALDGAHDATLPATERVSVVLAVAGPGLAKDVRHLEPGGTHFLSQKCAGGVGGGDGGSTLGSKSKGLAVAHTVLVATFR